MARKQRRASTVATPPVEPAATIPNPSAALPVTRDHSKGNGASPPLQDRVGPPFKIDAKKLDDMCKALVAGSTERGAARFIGITPRTFNEWKRRGRAEALRIEACEAEGRDPTPAVTEARYLEFWNRVTEAKAQFEVFACTNIAAAARQPGQWRAAAFLLERRMREEFGPVIRVAGKVDHQVTMMPSDELERASAIMREYGVDVKVASNASVIPPPPPQLPPGMNGHHDAADA